MTDREVMQMALDALEGIHVGNMTPMAEGNWNKAIEALRQALTQPEQEPVAWMDKEDCGDMTFTLIKPTYDNDFIPLYTAPSRKPWVGLTDEEIKGILDCGRGGLVDIKKAEQILKEKNDGNT